MNFLIYTLVCAKDSIHKLDRFRCVDDLSDNLGCCHYQFVYNCRIYISATCARKLE